MRVAKLKKELHAALSKAEAGSSQAAVLDRFLNVLDVLTWQEGDAATPDRTRGKITSFLNRLEAAHDGLGSNIVLPAFAINVLGEAMVRSNLIHECVVDFMKVSLYFYALDQIERRWSARAAIYTGIHADLIMKFLDRRELKSLIRLGAERVASGRVFCLTYTYLNALRKAYWEHCRASEDALDIAVVSTDQDRLEWVESCLEPVEADDHSLDSEDRIGLMLGIFSDTLTKQQQWIYLAKNRSAWRGTEGQKPDAAVDRLIATLDCRPPDGDLNWTEIAERLGINEKTAKREYLRALDTLLRSSAEWVFGSEWIPSGFVKRVLEQIRSIVRQKDLRIRNTTGRGMGPLVQKWEVALRYVLNHQRVSA